MAFLKKCKLDLAVNVSTNLYQTLTYIYNVSL